MRRGVGIFFIVVLILPFVLGQSGIPGDIGDNVEQLNNATETIRESLEEQRWDFLGDKWREILARNKAVQAINAFFTFLSPVFVVLFGQPYSLSLTLFFVVLIWIFFFFVFGRVLADMSTLGALPSFGIALVMVVISAHLGVFAMLAELLFKLIFFRDGWWGWIAFILFIVLWAAAIIFIRRFLYWNACILAKHSEAAAKLKEKMERDIFHIRVEGLEKGLAHVEEAFKK